MYQPQNYPKKTVKLTKTKRYGYITAAYAMTEKLL